MKPAIASGQSRSWSASAEPVKNEKSGWVLYLLGTALASLGRQDEAIGAFEALLQAEPKHEVAAECTYRLGLAHKALHHWEAASARFAEASAVAGFRYAPGATFQQAVCLHLAGKADDAVTTMKGLPAVPGQPAAVRRDGHRRAVAGGGGAGRRGAGAVEGPESRPGQRRGRLPLRQAAG